MHRRIKPALFAGIVLLLLATIPAAHAGEISNQATQVTFSQSVRIPGHTLPVGTYWFSVEDNGPNESLNTVKVSNATGTKTIAMLQTQTANQVQSGQEATVNGVTWLTGKVVFTFAEGGQKGPMTLVAWYYPGHPDGHKFIYSDRVQKQLNEEQHKTFAFNPKHSITIGSDIAAFK